MEPHLAIDLSKCIGCTACASVCIRGNIRMEVGHPTETGDGCMDCGHCMAVCPNDAIRLTCDPDFEPIEYDRKETTVDPGALLRLLERRRSIRRFTSDRVTPEEFDLLFSAARNSPTAINSRDVRFVVIDAELRRFLRHFADIMAPRAEELPRIRDLIGYLDDPFPMGDDPITWGGRQVILAFSQHQQDATIAMAQVEVMAYAMGLGGFHCGWIQMADVQDHERLMGFFPDIPLSYGLRSAFVIGHPSVGFTRTVPRDGPVVDYM